MLLILQIFSTLALAGVIWVIQLVQYPFFSYVERENFKSYHAAYTFWITPIVAPLMIVELLASVLLLIFPPEIASYKLLFFNFILTALVWLSTFFIQVPLHNKLSAGFDENAHLRLVKTNWIRTFIWSAHAVLVLFFLCCALEL